MSFTVNITLPFDKVGAGNEFASMAAVHRVATVVEQAGFTAGAVTDHPVPSARWLDAGGHYAQDPFVMLSMIGAITTRLKLQTNIVVLPYRNPFITARAVSSLDAFTGGRVLFGVGAGYLKAEYKALGADFDARNDLMDEYIRAMKLAWTGEDFTFDGTGYTALGNRVRPVPAQRPHPPILIGGNSKRALRRVAELGDGWLPFIQPKMVTDTSRTANISTDEDLIEARDYLFDYCEKIGRSDRPTLLLSGSFHMAGEWSAQEAIDNFAGMRALGISGSGASADYNTLSEWCDNVQRFGEDVIARMD